MAIAIIGWMEFKNNIGIIVNDKFFFLLFFLFYCERIAQAKDRLASSSLPFRI